MQSHFIELLSQYDVAGPRYTSYPTVPAWVETVTPADYKQNLSGLAAGESLSLYIHLPFCEKLCHFCGCMKVITADRSRSREYVDVVLEELNIVGRCLEGGARDVTQLHFGGGTPNFLQPAELADLMEGIRRHFNLLPEAEVAIEMHPRTSTQAFCDVLKELGFNRISLGVQDFDPVVQKKINRFQDYEMTAEMLRYLRGLGFEAFNFDLIYGLPGQSMSGWKKTLKQVLGLRPDRLAVYSYAHVPWKAPVQRSFQDSDLPSPKMKLELFEAAYETFTENGYRLIGMDHFARADDALGQAAEAGTVHRNFMGYSTQAEAHQLGFGVSAISYVGGNYFQNRKDLNDYVKAVAAGSPATFRGYLLNRDDAIRRALITQIMCNGFVDYAAFEGQWSIRFEDYFAAELKVLEAFVEDGLLARDEAGFRVLDLGHLLLRNIAMVFDIYLEGIRRNATTPTFSRTV